MDLQERINKKLQQIEKLKTHITKWENKKSLDAYIKDVAPWYSATPKSIKTFDELIDARYRIVDINYPSKTKEDTKKYLEEDYGCYINNCNLEIIRTTKTLEEAKSQLDTLYAISEKQSKEKELLDSLPESVITFKNNLISRWDKYDLWKREEIIKLYRDETIEYKERKKLLTERFGRGWYDFKYLTDEQIHNSNVKDANNLILDMIKRVECITGKITNTCGLRLDYSNQGFSIINGFIEGEKGKAIVESIEAGGYNIQRLHIRVLVKEVKQHD